MTNESRWAWCLPGPCAGGTDTGEAAEEAAAVGCKAPAGIEDAASPACAEGEFIPLGSWCTPKCATGKGAIIRLSGVANDACPNPENNWGSKLCCLDGQIQPQSAFECVDDPFDEMDTNHDGQLSRREYESEGHSAVTPNLADAEAKAVVILTDAKAQAEATAMSGQAAGSSSQAPDDPDPLVWSYLLIVTVFLLAAATAAVVWLMQHAKHKIPHMDLRMPHMNLSMPHLHVSFETRKTEEVPVQVQGEGKKQTQQAPLEPELLTVVGLGAAAGTYRVVPEETRNDRPLWKHSDGTKYVFHSPEGKWLVAGSAAADASFATEAGLLRSKEAQPEMLPHELGTGIGKWQVFDGSNWIDDETAGIIIATA